MPNIFPNYGFKIGRKHEPKLKKPKLDTAPPSCTVLIVESPQLKLFSVQINSKHNRVFVVQSSSDFVCHSEKCKEKRAVECGSWHGLPCVRSGLFWRWWGWFVVAGASSCVWVALIGPACGRGIGCGLSSEV